MALASCALCDCHIQNIEFDLQKSLTLYSKTSLLLVLQDCIQDQFSTSNFDICKMCYLLLNELDGIKLRAKAIEDQLKNYVNKYSTPPDKTEECTICRKKIPLKSFKAHLKTQHPELNELETTFDFDDVNSISDINPSLGDILEDDKPSIKVEQPQNSPKKRGLPNLKPYKCPECGKLWKTAAELKSHLQSHSSERPYICEICGQAYKRQKALAIHVGMHNGINPFTCVYCNKSFTQKGALVRHTPIHTGELPFQCDACGKRFAHHTSFKMHKLSHSGQKSFKCEICGLLLMSGSHLKRHMRVHTGEKKYSCHTCGKKFAERYNLGVHEKLHLGVSIKKKYQCHVCDNWYSRQIKLEEHLLTAHHKIENISTE